MPLWAQTPCCPYRSEHKTVAASDVSRTWHHFRRKCQRTTDVRPTATADTCPAPPRNDSARLPRPPCPRPLTRSGHLTSHSPSMSPRPPSFPTHTNSHRHARREGKARLSIRGPRDPCARPPTVRDRLSRREATHQHGRLDAACPYPGSPSVSQRGSPPGHTSGLCMPDGMAAHKRLRMEA